MADLASGEETLIDCPCISHLVSPEKLPPSHLLVESACLPHPAATAYAECQTVDLFVITTVIQLSRTNSTFRRITLADLLNDKDYRKTGRKPHGLYKK